MYNSNIDQLLPIMYNSIVEMQAIMNSENNLFDTVHDVSLQVQNNQYVMTSDEQGISKFEHLLNIIPDTETETLAFRRQRVMNRLCMKPPYSLQALKIKLDEIIGEGQYNVILDANNYTLYVESSAYNQQWFNEIRITMTKYKPANIVFINKPLISYNLALNEEVHYKGKQYNYGLGTSWILGAKPFIEYIEKGVIVLSSVSSVQTQFLNNVASFAASEIASVLVNNSIAISTFVTKSSSTNTVTVEYEVTDTQTTEIQNIKLLDSSSNILTQSAVYVPVDGTVLLKHTILVKEG